MNTARIKFDKDMVKLLESGGEIMFDVAKPVTRIRVVMPKDGKGSHSEIFKKMEERLRKIDKYLNGTFKSMDAMFDRIFGHDKQYWPR